MKYKVEYNDGNIRFYNASSLSAFEKLLNDELKSTVSLYDVNGAYTSGRVLASYSNLDLGKFTEMTNIYQVTFTDGTKTTYQANNPLDLAAQISQDTNKNVNIDCDSNQLIDFPTGDIVGSWTKIKMKSDMKWIGLYDYVGDKRSEIITDINTFDLTKWVHQTLDHGEFIIKQVFKDSNEYLVFYKDTHIFYARVFIQKATPKYVLKDTKSDKFFTRQYGGGFVETNKKYAQRIINKQQAQSIVNFTNALYGTTNQFIVEEIY
jgi:hypothetical protein